MPSPFYVVAFLIPLLLKSALGIQVFPSPGALPNTVPLSCRTALTANISCPEAFITARDVVYTRPLEDAFLRSYCVERCKNSLQTFQSTVTRRCGIKKYAFGPSVNQTAGDIAEALGWAYNVSCQQDSSSTSFCLSKILNGTVGECDACILKYEAALVSSKFGDRVMDQDEFKSKLSSCSVPASSYPIPTRTTDATTSSSMAISTCDTKSYTVKEGDSCGSIARANSVGQDLLIARNKLDYACASLTEGDELCLGDTCTLHMVVHDDSCATVLAGLDGVTTQELTSWNPTIHKNCDNLDIMIGRVICISPPASTWDIGQPSGNSSSKTGFIFTPSILPTTKMSVVEGTGSTVSANNATTRTQVWAIPTVPTRTRTADPARWSAIQERVKWCPDFSNATISFDELPKNCRDAWAPYCAGATTSPVLPSPSDMASSCEPSYYAANNTSASETA